MILKVWERGAGLTRACGSAACAAVVAAVRLDLTGRKVRVSLPGGDLSICWRESDGHVLMSGAVELENEGVFAAAVSRASPSRLRDGRRGRHLRLSAEYGRIRGHASFGAGNRS